MRLNRRTIGRMLVQMGQLDEDNLDRDMRSDAGETAAFTRQLEYVMTEVYRVEYPELRAREFIPINSRVAAGAESFVWRLWDWVGMAKILSSFADDLPTVEIMAAEIAQVCKTLGIGYNYTVQDIAAAQLSGMPLDTEKASAARRAHENAIEVLAAVGNAAAGLPDTPADPGRSSFHFGAGLGKHEEHPIGEHATFAHHPVHEAGHPAHVGPGQHPDLTGVRQE
jgi:hypothetical protein